MSDNTIVDASQQEDEIKITLADGRMIRVAHEQDCCESVWLEDSDGEISDSIGKKLLSITKEYSEDHPPSVEYEPESHTWTFIYIKTSLETITYRFFGESNGYYSEDADIFSTDQGNYISGWTA